MERIRVPRPYREIGKPLAVRMVELLRALQLIFDSILAVRTGRLQHLISLSGQLRALLTERSSKADPLLLELAKLLGKSLDIYCMPDVDNPEFPESLRKNMVLHVTGFPITIRRQFAAQRKLSFSGFLDYQIIHFKGTRYTPRNLIEWYANWAGGAHYSRQLPEDFAALLSLNAMGFQPVANLLLQLGEATLSTGRDLLKSVVDLEIHTVIVVPAQKVSELTYLFDARFEGTSMRLSLALDKRLVPSFRAIGLQGITGTVQADRLIDWSAPRHLQASVTIDEDLTTLLELVIDGERVGRSRVPQPLFVLSDPMHYDSYHNRAVDGKEQDFSFGVIEVVMYGSEVPPVGRANLLLHFEEKRNDPELPIIAYTPRSYGHAPRGTKNLSMTGLVKHLKVRDLLPDFDAKRQSILTDAGTPIQQND